ncbi:hypothetical protein PF005_g3229 [Phytophthora fragariae]|uniref:Uncharacterized protein n=1 Tax=Phytophthora fragariae TaxID=53985 RepID=A0A6A3Z9R7_9STRA|nr:hypothetical protein PF005_g3229 [Phytophthora fragariae]
MPRSTVELLHKRAEHNEGIISTLEKISLHQEEQEKIENNVIDKMEGLTHMKELRYLNMALNNTRSRACRAASSSTNWT